MSKAHPRNKPTVLVVDDAVAVSTTLTWVLRQNGYNCIAVGSRAEAVRICAGVAPDVALIEMSLSDGSGLDTARDLRRYVPGCRMLLMASDPESGEHIQAARAMGFDCEVIPKPIPAEELLQKVKDALAQPV
jgi:DNA-binding response OmpR family regulator